MAEKIEKYATLKEGTIRRGGVKPKPMNQKPNIRPKPQKPPKK